MQSSLWKMILIVALPLMLVIIAVASIGIVYALQYKTILNNVTTASDFNQDFKYNVDDKMYHFVIESQYSLKLPEIIEEVQSAEAIARKLFDTTTQKESLRAISSVLNYCHNLKEYMHQIADTEGYDSRMNQLKNDIEMSTELI